MSEIEFIQPQQMMNVGENLDIEQAMNMSLIWIGQASIDPEKYRFTIEYLKGLMKKERLSRMIKSEHLSEDEKFILFSENCDKCSRSHVEMSRQMGVDIDEEEWPFDVYMRTLKENLSQHYGRKNEHAVDHEYYTHLFEHLVLLVRKNIAEDVVLKVDVPKEKKETEKTAKELIQEAKEYVKKTRQCNCDKEDCSKCKTANEILEVKL